MTPTTLPQHRMLPATRVNMARFARLALVALLLCIAVPALAAFEAWEIDAARVLAP